MRAVGGGQKVIGMTANQVLHVAKEEWFPGRAFFSRDGLGRFGKDLESQP